jgi:hypothetical protein
VGTTASTVNFLKNRAADLASDTNVVMAKSPEEKAAVINKLLINDALRQQTAIRPNEPNIYASMPPLAVAQAVPALLSKQYKFLQETVYPMGEAAPNQPINDETILAAAMNTIQKDPSRLNEIVSSVGSYYSAAVLSNNKLRGYRENGLPLQDAYKAQIQNSARLGGTGVVDLTDTLALREYFMNNLGGAAGGKAFMARSLSN